MSKSKTTLAQLLARSDNELRTYDAAQVATRAGLIIEAQLENGGAWFRVQDTDHKSGGLHVKAGGVWCKPFRTVFYRTVAEYNAVVLQRSGKA